MELNLGIAGFGGMGSFHASRAPLAGVNIAAVCDIREAAAGKPKKRDCAPTAAQRNCLKIRP